jgi:hypothetical protein
MANGIIKVELDMYGLITGITLVFRNSVLMYKLTEETRILRADYRRAHNHGRERSSPEELLFRVYQTLRDDKIMPPWNRPRKVRYAIKAEVSQHLSF